MAHRLKWLFGVLLGMLLMTWLVGTVVQWDPLRMESGNWPEGRRFADVSSDLAATHRALQMMHRADSLATRMRYTHPATSVAPLYLDVPDRLREDAHQRLVEHSLSEIPADGSARARIVVAVVSPLSGRRADIERAGSSHVNELYAGTDEEGPYCIAAGVSYFVDRDSAFGFSLRRGPVPRWEQLQTSALGACRLWARYGAPGDSIAEWLAAGGTRFAEFLDSGIDPDTLTRPRALRGVRALQRVLEVPHAFKRCLAGDEHGCVDALTTPVTQLQLFEARLPGELLPPDVRVFQRYAPWSGTLGGLEGAVLADMERDLGPERFGAFWRGSGSVDEAYFAATGVQLGAWLRGWAQARYGTMPRGPGVDTVAIVLSVLLAAVALLAALTVAQWRRI
jgi:hypothetical protein